MKGFEQPQENREEASLLEQYEQRQTLELPGGSVDVVHVKPENCKTEVPTLIAPGLSASAEVYKDVIIESAKYGRDTLAIETSGYDNLPKRKEGDARMPEAESRNVAALIDALEAGGIEKIDAVAHSQGGAWIVEAARLYPEKFRNLVLVNPAGMVGPDTTPRLAFGLMKDLVRQNIDSLRKKVHYREPGKRATIEGAKMIVKHPEVLEEAMVISRVQIDEILAELKKQGIGISIIQGVDDQVFPMERVQKMAKADQVDGFYSVEGIHNMIYLEPKKYMELIDVALDDLEAKRAKKAA